MFIRWRKIQTTSLIRAKSGCGHGVPTTRMDPRLCEAYSENGVRRSRILWFGPSLRKCCLGLPQVRCAWWKRVDAQTQEAHPNVRGLIEASSHIFYPSEEEWKVYKVYLSRVDLPQMEGESWEDWEVRRWQMAQNEVAPDLSPPKETEEDPLLCEARCLHATARRYLEALGILNNTLEVLSEYTKLEPDSEAFERLALRLQDPQDGLELCSYLIQRKRENGQPDSQTAPPEEPAVVMVAPVEPGSKTEQVYQALLEAPDGLTAAEVQARVGFRAYSFLNHLKARGMVIDENSVWKVWAQP